MKYYIIAGEASGDLHGSNLMRALLTKERDAEIRFWGGDRMARVAKEHGDNKINMARHIRDLAFMGIVEVMEHLSEVLGNIRFCKRDIMEFNPDAMIFIDYPSFNLRIAKYTHKKGIYNFYYISPQIWAWKSYRIKSMRRNLDKLCYILPSEKKFYSINNFPQAVYVGHPLLDAVSHYKKDFHEKNVESTGKPKIALLPGSRKQELHRMLPTMMELALRHPEYQFTIAGMTLLGEAFYRPMIPVEATNIDIIFDHTYDLLAQSHAALVCSGTATMETGLFRVPQVVCYQCNKLSAAIARRLIAARIKYISLVNLTLDKPAVCELIQDDFNIDRLEEEFRLITIDEENRKRMIGDYDAMIEELGGEGASERAAEELVNRNK